MDSVDELAKRRARLEREIDRVSARIETLQNIADEPVFEDGEPTVIWFKRKFLPYSNIYTYAAVRTGDGQWFTTGPKSPKFESWAALYQWVIQDPDAVIWLATEWEEVQ